jgi:hypothetical protein
MNKVALCVTTWDTELKNDESASDVLRRAAENYVRRNK